MFNGLYRKKNWQMAETKRAFAIKETLKKPEAHFETSFISSSQDFTSSRLYGDYSQLDFVYFTIHHFF